MLEKTVFSPRKNHWLFPSLSLFSYTNSVTWWYCSRNIFKKLFWSHYILHNIFYLKLYECYFIKNSHICLTVRSAAIYIGETVQVFTFQKFTFSWNYLQYKTTACEKKITLMLCIIYQEAYDKTIVCLLTKRWNFA